MQNDLKLIGLKAGILALGVYYTDAAMFKLNEMNLVTNGNGLFNYNQLDKNEIYKLAPNEIHIKTIDGVYRIESRYKKDNTVPYTVLVDNDDFYLHDNTNNTYYEIQFPPNRKYCDKITQNGQKMGNVMKIMGKNILRLYPDMRCVFAEELSMRCKFCNTFYDRPQMDDNDILDDIAETLEKIKEELDIKGFFMSTGAFFDDSRTDFYYKVLKILRNKLPDSNIVFSLAPQKDKKNLEKLYSIENIILSFNMESSDPERWDVKNNKCLGIGKSNVGMDYYMESYKQAAKIGNIKSNFIIGLDNLKIFKEGVMKLADIGVSSSGTIYYSTPGSIWNVNKIIPTTDDFNRNTVDFILETYTIIAESIIKNNFKIGWNQESRISGLEWDIYNYLKNKKLLGLK